MRGENINNNMAKELDGADSSSSKKEEKVGKVELRRIDSLLADSTNVPIRIKKSPRTMKQKLRSHDVLKTILSEHLSAYLIVGYDLNEEEFFVIRSNSPLETRALTNLIDDSIGALYEQGILTGGPSPFQNRDNDDEDDDEEDE